MSASEYLLIGFLGAMLLIAVLALLYILFRVERRLQVVDVLARSISDLDSTANQVQEQLKILRPAMLALVKTSRSMEDATVAIRGLSGLLTTGKPPEEPPTPWVTRGAPPLNPNLNDFAAPDEAGYLEQTDEDLAEIEREEELRQQGIETDPLRVARPMPGQINQSSV